MRVSAIVVLVGIGLFVLPIPGTFIAGGLVALLGVGLRLFGV